MAGKPKNKIGQRHGNLVVKKLSNKRDKSGGVYYFCLCDCGNTRETPSSKLTYNTNVKNRALFCIDCAIKNGYKKSAETSSKKRIKENLDLRGKLKGIVSEDLLKLPSTQKQALLENKPHYFTGKKCKRGHLEKRSTRNAKCLECAREEIKKRRSTPEGKEYTKLASKKRWADPVQKAKAQETRKNWANTKEGRKKLRAAGKKFYHANKARLRVDKRKSDFKRYQNDPFYRLEKNLRRVVILALKNQGKLNKRVKEYIGIKDLQVLKDHLEVNFHDGMSWDNYGRWHVDHIRPTSSFDKKSEEQRMVAFNWRNLQPMWALDNEIKKDNFNYLDQVKWVNHMRSLGFEGDLFLIKFD